MSMKYCYRDLSQPAMLEPLKGHMTVTFKLVKMVAEFAQKMSTVHEQYAAQVKAVVNMYRKKNLELARERPVDCPSSLEAAWDSLLAEVEVDGQAHTDMATRLQRSVYSPLMEVAAYKKSQAKKVYSFQEAFEGMIDKSEDQMNELHRLYEDSYQTYTSNSGREVMKINYLNSHNDYVLQLKTCNKFIEVYNMEMLPSCLEELEEIYIDTSNTLNGAIEMHSFLLVSKARDECRRYEGILNVCKQVNPKTDVMHFVKALNPQPDVPLAGKLFGYQYPGDISSLAGDSVHRNNIVMDKSTENALKTRRQGLQKEAAELTSYLNQNQEAIHSLVNICQRNLANRLYSKVYETQQELCLKRNEARIANMRLAAIRPQMTSDIKKKQCDKKVKHEIEVLSPKQNGEVANGQESLMKSRSQNSIRKMWKRAFKSIKSTSGDQEDATAVSEEKTSETDSSSQKSRPSSGMRGFLKRLDSRDKSERAREVEEDAAQHCDLSTADPVYSLLKCASDLSRGRNQCDNCVTGNRLTRQGSQTSTQSSSTPTQERRAKLQSMHQKSQSCDTSDPANYIREQQRRRVTLRRKSFSMDSSEAMEIAKEERYLLESQKTSQSATAKAAAKWLQRRRTMHEIKSIDRSDEELCWRATNRPSNHQYSSKVKDGSGHPPDCTTSCTPTSIRERRANLRMKSLSVDIADTPTSVDESLKRVSSSCSVVSFPQSEQAAQPNTSERRKQQMLRSNSNLDEFGRRRSPSPMTRFQDQARQMFPCNLYVVLHSYLAREHDDLTIRAGWRVKAIDTSDPDWWKGRCNGKVGYFPAKCVQSVHPGQKVFQVMSGLELCEGDTHIKLSRDQIVVQAGPEEVGMILIKVGDKQLRCPAKYLVEV